MYMIMLPIYGVYDSVMLRPARPVMMPLCDALAHHVIGLTSDHHLTLVLLLSAGKDTGTPFLRDGVHLESIIKDDEASESSDWHGFD